MGLVTLIFSIPAVQTTLARYATNALNKTLGTHIAIDRVGVSLFTLNAGIRGAYIQDHKKDTLVYIRRLHTSILNLNDVTNGTMALGTVAMEGVYIILKTYKSEAQTNLDVFVEKIANQTQITLVCGGCQPLVEEMLGSANLDVAEMLLKQDLGQGIFRFQFRPVSKAVVKYQPGQHLLPCDP